MAGRPVSWDNDDRYKNAEALNRPGVTRRFGNEMNDGLRATCAMHDPDREPPIDVFDGPAATPMTLPPASASMPDCKHPAGRFVPVVDPNRCEGKSACVAECPYDVFVVRRRERDELPGLGLLGSVKWWLHGGMQAEAVRADQCHGCGLCVSACPEGAITLKRP